MATTATGAPRPSLRPRRRARPARRLRRAGVWLPVDDLPVLMRRPRPEHGDHGDRRATPEPPPAPVVLLAAGEVPSPRQLRQLVEEFHGNVKEVAAFLGKDRKQIYRWLRRARIDPAAYRPGEP